jgi:hypothetical protein
MVSVNLVIFFSRFAPFSSFVCFLKLSFVSVQFFEVPYSNRRAAILGMV